MMRKMIAIAVVLVLCISLSVPAFARTATGNGYTSGDNKIKMHAELVVSNYSAQARTYFYGTIGDPYTLAMTVIFYYTNQSNQTQTDSGTGKESASAGNSGGKGIRATSEHSFTTNNDIWGNWHYELEAAAG